MPHIHGAPTYPNFDPTNRISFSVTNYVTKIFFMGKLHAMFGTLMSVHAYKFIIKEAEFQRTNSGYKPEIPLREEKVTYHIDIVDSNGHEIPLSYSLKRDWESVLDIIQIVTTPE